MIIAPKTLALAAVACILILPSCGSVPGGGTLGTTVLPDTVTISPHPASMPAGSTMTFTCTETGGTGNNCGWVVEDPGGITPVGTPTTLSNSSTFLYTAPAAPPVYSGFIPSSQQGIVSVFADFGTGSTTITFPITTTTISVGITYPSSPPTVALNASQQFEGYAVGNVNNAITWQVNGVTGGSVATGTIVNSTGSSAGLYTAPAVIPMTGSSVTITAVSQADPTKSASVIVTLH
jgi:hypothetical protein